MPGRAIIRASWVADLVFAGTALSLAAGLDGLEPVAIGVALMLFAVSLGVWSWAFAVAVARSTEGDDIAVGSLFLLEGSVPKGVRGHLYGALGVCLLVTALSASSDPFGVLVPMLPLGLAGLWGARHGEFPLRPELRSADRPERPERPARTTRVRRGTGGRAGE